MLNKLKNVRLNLGLTQSEMAKALNISRSSYSVWESSSEIIPLKHLISFCNYCNISLDYYFGLTDIDNYVINKLSIQNNIVGERLKEFRKENKLTQVKLAKELNTVHPVIVNYENGKHLISTPFLYTICKNYKISADYLLGRVDEPKYLK